jgi:nitrogen fixation protein NifU and related proteins
MYADVILDHYRHPRNQGSLDNPDVVHEELNPLCGDRVRIELAIAEDGSIRAARFRGDLCMIARAATSLLTEMIIGAALDNIEEFPQQKLLHALQTEISAARLNCALLPLSVLKTAVRSYQTR